jgi:hypothetical protein
MPNPEYSENPDRKYLAKGKHGIKPSVLFPKKASASVKVKYPGIPKKGMKFIKPGCPEKY